MLFPIWFSSLFWNHRQTTLPVPLEMGENMWPVLAKDVNASDMWTSGLRDLRASGLQSTWSQRVRHNWSTEQACTCYLHTFSLEASVGFWVPSMVSCTMQICFLLLLPIWVANPHLSLFILYTWRQVSFPFKTFHWIVMMETKAIFII